MEISFELLLQNLFNEPISIFLIFQFWVKQMRVGVRAWLLEQNLPTERIDKNILLYLKLASLPMLLSSLSHGLCTHFWNTCNLTCSFLCIKIKNKNWITIKYLRDVWIKILVTGMWAQYWSMSFLLLNQNEVKWVEEVLLSFVL